MPFFSLHSHGKRAGLDVIALDVRGNWAVQMCLKFGANHVYKAWMSEQSGRREELAGGAEPDPAVASFVELIEGEAQSVAGRQDGLFDVVGGLIPLFEDQSFAFGQFGGEAASYRDSDRVGVAGFWKSGEASELCSVAGVVWRNNGHTYVRQPPTPKGSLLF